MFLSEVFFWGEGEARRGAKQGGDGAPATWGVATARGATFFLGGWTSDDLMLKGEYPLQYNYDGWIEYHLASAIIPRNVDLKFSSSLNLPRVLFYYAFFCSSLFLNHISSTKCHFIQWNHERKNSRGRLRTRRRGQKKSSHFDHGSLTMKNGGFSRTNTWDLSHDFHDIWLNMVVQPSM